MRIPDSYQVSSPALSGDLSSAKVSAQTGSSTVSSNASTSSNSDQVSLSGAAQLLRSSAADRNDKIASLSASVRSDQYKISSTAVSRSLVSETLARSANS